MIEYDELEQRMVLKLVYYGPALSGKTTNLLHLHNSLKIDGRGDLMTLDTKDDRTLFFDLLPFYFSAPSGLKIKVKVYTVPGQVQHDSTRKAVLTRADGIAFIADSQVSESTNNVESFKNLEQNLVLVGLDIEKIPVVIQFNKRDLKNIAPEEEIKRVWQPTRIPICYASALNGIGVIETFKWLAEGAYDLIDQCHGLNNSHDLTRESFIGKLTQVCPESSKE